MKKLDNLEKDHFIDSSSGQKPLSPSYNELLTRQKKEITPLIEIITILNSRRTIEYNDDDSSVKLFLIIKEIFKNGYQCALSKYRNELKKIRVNKSCKEFKGFMPSISRYLLNNSSPERPMSYSRLSDIIARIATHCMQELSEFTGGTKEFSEVKKLKDEYRYYSDMLTKYRNNATFMERDRTSAESRCISLRDKIPEEKTYRINEMSEIFKLFINIINTKLKDFSFFPKDTPLAETLENLIHILDQQKHEAQNINQSLFDRRSELRSCCKERYLVSERNLKRSFLGLFNIIQVKIRKEIEFKQENASNHGIYLCELPLINIKPNFYPPVCTPPFV